MQFYFGSKKCRKIISDNANNQERYSSDTTTPWLNDGEKIPTRTKTPKKNNCIALMVWPYLFDNNYQPLALQTSGVDSWVVEVVWFCFFITKRCTKTMPLWRHFACSCILVGKSSVWCVCQLTNQVVEW